MFSRRTFFVLTVLSSSVAAQAPATLTPAAVCRQAGTTRQSELIKIARDSGRVPDALVIIPEAKRVTAACAETLSTTRGTVAELAALSGLYLYVGDTAKAKSIVDALSRRSGTESDRADALLASLSLENAALDPFAGINEKAEAVVRSIDAMSDAVLTRKLSAHSTMLGRYEYADIDDGIKDHATKLLALSRQALRTKALPMTPVVPAQGTRAAIPSYDPAYRYMLTAYGSLARAAGDYLHADSALMILDRGEAEIGEAYPSARESLERDRAMYRLVGTRAAPVDGKWWVNAPDGTVMQPGNGKISIVQFTAHWCVPCKKSYPPMLRLMAKYKGKPVESVMSTGIYGYVGDKRNLTPDQEVAADREYYAEHHGLPFPVAINPQGAGADDKYKVGGIPEIVIVDQQGFIRATVVGWDRGNEARFAAFIDKLLIKTP